MRRYHDYPKLLEEHYIRRMRETYRLRAERLAAIRTPAQAREYQVFVRAELARAFGPLPERNPLNTRVWRTDDRVGYRLEHLTFESRPGFLVTANLYLPPASGPAPAVLFTCGHYAAGKAGENYRQACARLAEAGYVVLSYDPINQGERALYTLIEDGEVSPPRDACSGHNVVGRQLHACGDWLGAWRAWDGIRALDCLLERPEVDPRRVGVTGQSGGGTLSSFLWALDPRLAAVASACWCTSYLLDLENSMPADEEQYPPGFLAAGLDKSDFFLSRAGDPTLLLGQELDFFDDRGLHAAYDELLRFHTLLGGDPAACRLHLDNQTHALTAENQLEMVKFFGDIFGMPAPSHDEPVDVPTEEELTVTPEGDVLRAGSRPVYVFIGERAAALVAARPGLSCEAVPAAVRQALGVPESVPVPYHRRLFQTGCERPGTDQVIYRFLVERDDVPCVLRHVCPPGQPFRMCPEPCTTLYLPNLDSQTELADPATMAGVEAFWTLDPRGLGEGLFSLEDPHYLYGHEYMLTGHGVLYGESLLGARITDVLAAVRLLRCEGAQEISLIGRKQGALLALLAGVLDPDIATVSSLECPESFLALTAAPFTLWPAVNFPRNVLSAFDLPDLRTALRERLVADTLASPIGFADEIPHR